MYTQTKSPSSLVRTAHTSAILCLWLNTQVHNTAQQSSDNLHAYPRHGHSHHSSDVAYRRRDVPLNTAINRYLFDGSRASLTRMVTTGNRQGFRTKLITSRHYAKTIILILYKIDKMITITAYYGLRRRYTMSKIKRKRTVFEVCIWRHKSFH